MAEKCGCKVYVRATNTAVGEIRDARIEYCPLHSAAEKLRDAGELLSIAAHLLLTKLDHNVEFKETLQRRKDEFDIALAAARGEKP